MVDRQVPEANPGRGGVTLIDNRHQWRAAKRLAGRKQSFVLPSIVPRVVPWAAAAKVSVQLLEGVGVR